jgi:hypothetical protein
MATLGPQAARAMSAAPPLERFWSKLDAQLPLVGSWEWHGARTANGYGSFRVGDGIEYAHRVAYELLVAPVPPGLQIDHLCQNRGCVPERY